MKKSPNIIDSYIRGLDVLLLLWLVMIVLFAVSGVVIVLALIITLH